MGLQAKPSQQPGTGDTPDSVCLRQFTASANPRAHEQRRRSRSSPHLPVIFRSPVLRWLRLRRVRRTPLPAGGRRLRSGSYRSAGRAAWGTPRSLVGPRPPPGTGPSASAVGAAGVRDWGADRRSVRPVYHRRADPGSGPAAVLRPGMVILADRNFLSHVLARAVLATDAHILWRASASFALTPVRGCPMAPSWPSSSRPARPAARR